MDSRQITSLSLLERVRAQDQTAWQRLVNLYGSLVVHWCLRWGVKQEDARDVVQEVFLAVASGLNDFQRQGAGSFRSWIRGITRHKVLDHHRREQRQPASATGGTEAQLRIQDVAEVADEDEENVEVSNLYRRALDLIRTDFTENTWQAFLRVAVDGRPTDAVAAELGMSPVSVRVAKSRVLARLRQELQDLID